MARIKIGNIKGPKGDTGARGATGPAGPIGPQGPLPPLTNNFLATVAGQSALDAAAGKILKDQLDQQNSDLNTVETGLGNIVFTPLSDKPTSGYTVSNDSYVHRSAVGQVDLFCDLQAGTVRNVWHTVAFIPAGYRPAIFKCLQCVLFDTDNAPVNIRCFAYSDGNIKVFNHLPDKNYTLRIFGSYFVSK